MSRRTISILLPVVIATAISLAASADDGSRFVDRVGTLELDTELDARGNLGGIASDRLGFLYVANFRDAVWRVDPDSGEVTTISRAQYGASGLAVDRRGRLYQSNFLGDTITEIDRRGNARELVSEGLEGPVGVAVADDGTFFVCNCRGNTIAKVTPDGRAEPFAQSDLFACPNGIVFGGDDKLYVTNFNSHDILSVSPEGEVNRFATVPGGSGNAHLVRSKGVFYVTKIIANRVVKVTADGEVLPLAGTGQPGHDDGPALEATFFRPNGIAASTRGDTLYVTTMIGEFGQPRPSTITIRTIELVTISSVLREALAEGGLDAAVEAYRAYKSDPVRSKENTSGEMITLGYAFLSDRDVTEATRFFRLNASSYPEDANAQYHLGEAYRYTGRVDEAVEQYRKTLELAPDDARARSRLTQMDRE